MPGTRTTAGPAPSMEMRESYSLRIGDTADGGRHRNRSIAVGRRVADRVDGGVADRGTDAGVRNRGCARRTALVVGSIGYRFASSRTDRAHQSRGHALVRALRGMPAVRITSGHAGARVA